MNIKLGHVYTDRIHGLFGVAVSHTRYLTGCDRVLLESAAKGELKEYWFDATMLVEVSATDDNYRAPVIPPHAQPATVAEKPGGPRKAPPSRNP